MPELIPGAQVDVMVEVKEGMGNSEALDNAHPKWFGARVLRLVDVPASSAAIQSLLEASSGSDHSWEVGWTLAAHSNSPQKHTDDVQTQENNDVTSSSESDRIRQKLSNVNMMALLATRIAVLEVPALLNKDLPEIMISPSSKRGDILLAMGSPFGILSSPHFFNSISMGSVANYYPPMSLDKSLLMADIRCLPGMEGSPIFGLHACLIGILTRPLRQSGGAEIQVVIPWRAIEAACNGFFQSIPQTLERVGQHTGSFHDTNILTFDCLKCRASPNGIHKLSGSYCSPPLPVEEAMSSVCLITLENGVWASGVLINKEGLILTNAHLLEPWRFGRTTIQSVRDETKMKNPFNLYEDSTSQVLPSNASEPFDFLHKGHASYNIHQFHRQIRVRLDLTKSRVWCDAKVVYVSKGPLDISLLQLESVPSQLWPVSVDMGCPSPGSKAFVIGHGLLGPRCDMLPSICSGVVAKVVKAKRVVPHLSMSDENQAGEVPVMLETTASVHPGGSGGAVVNSSGHMIGLVTSNAKHGGGTVIPHMNFSIPSAALEPIFIFAKDMQNISLLQQLDRPNKGLGSIWAMMPPISPNPGPSLPGVADLVKDKEDKAKGSRFAKFINERQELFRKSNHLNTVQDLSRDTIPSKL